jgi:hypothetical protein
MASFSEGFIHVLNGVIASKIRSLIGMLILEMFGLSIPIMRLANSSFAPWLPFWGIGMQPWL